MFLLLDRVSPRDPGCPRCRLHAAVAAIVLASILAPAPAAADGRADAAEPQRDRPRPVSVLEPHVPEGFDPQARGLSPEPLLAEAMGLAMLRPAGAIVTTERSGGRSALVLHDGSPEPAWSMSIQHLTSSQPGATAESHIQEYLEALTAAGSPPHVVANEPFEAGNINGRLAVLEQRGAGDERFVSGWLVLPAGGEVFLVASFLTVPEQAGRVRPMLEAAFSTIVLRSSAEISLQRRSRIETGRAFIDSITEERLRDLAGISQWSRIYRQGSDGRETEIGYSLLETLPARRGALNPNRPESAYSAKENEEGFLVQIHARLIGDVGRNLFFDTLAMYWIAWDGSEEEWSMRATQRQGDASRTETETGIRVAASAGQPRPTLTVIRELSHRRDPAEWAVPDVYLSQALGVLLGRLLVQEEAEPREMAYYYYHAADRSPNLTQRTDRWERGSREKPRSRLEESSNWRLTTRFSADALPVVSTFGPDGTFIRTRRADGTITQPMSLDQIRGIWQRKGLPMGQDEQSRSGRSPGGRRLR